MKKGTVSSFTNTTRLSLTFKIGGIFLCSFVVFIAVILPLSVYTVDSTAHTAVHNIVTKQLQSSLNMGAEYLHTRSDNRHKSLYTVPDPAADGKAAAAKIHQDVPGMTCTHDFPHSGLLPYRVATV